MAEQCPAVIAETSAISLADILAIDNISCGVAAQAGLVGLTRLGELCPLLADQKEFQPLESSAPEHWDLRLSGEESLCALLKRRLAILQREPAAPGEEHLDGTIVYEEILARSRQQPDSVSISELGRFRECIDAQQGSGWAPLHTAAAAGNNGVCGLLLALRADPNAKDGKGETPLMKAVHNDNVNIADVLARGGADLNVTNARRRTALSVACSANSLQMVDVLLAHCAKTDICDTRAWSPLMFAAAVPKARGGGTAVLASLLRAGAKDRPTRGQSALEVARRARNAGAVALLEGSLLLEASQEASEGIEEPMQIAAF